MSSPPPSRNDVPFHESYARRQTPLFLPVDARQCLVCALTDEGKKLLKAAIDELGLSARAYDKILKVARTIADLASEDNILPEHLAEAIQYRSLDRNWWG